MFPSKFAKEGEKIFFLSFEIGKFERKKLIKFLCFLKVLKKRKSSGVARALPRLLQSAIIALETIMLSR